VAWVQMTESNPMSSQIGVARLLGLVALAERSGSIIGKKTMIGAIAVDIIGSVYEWNRIKTKRFELFNPLLIHRIRRRSRKLGC
jgi:hypothetical protein